MRADDDLRELGEALHSRLLAGVDLSVTAAILETFLPKLFARLRAQFRHCYDLVDTEQAALDTLASYIDTPEKFDPAKGSLLGYFVMDASRNLKNALKLKKNSVRFDPPATEEEIQELWRANRMNQQFKNPRHLYGKFASWCPIGSIERSFA